MRVDSGARLLTLMDAIFRIVFARYRRQVGDGNLEAAWRRASYKVCWFLVVPAGGLASVVMIIAASMRNWNGPITGYEQAVAIVLSGAVLMAVTSNLNARFRKFLAAPPALAAEESAQERWLVFRFRAVAVGFFVIVFLVGVALREIAQAG